MNIKDIYDKALYLGEKTDDSTGFIDNEYKKQHEKKAEILIREAIRKFAYLENINMTDIDNYDVTKDIPLSSYILKSVIPTYVAAILCSQDMEQDKYNILISEYENSIKNIKHEEEVVDFNNILSGLE